MHMETLNSLEATIKSTEKKPYSQPKLVEYGELNDVTESLHAFSSHAVLDSLVAVTVL